jgi:membrane-bound lytic murein transglycosylase D
MTRRGGTVRALLVAAGVLVAFGGCQRAGPAPQPGPAPRPAATPVPMPSGDIGEDRASQVTRNGRIPQVEVASEVDVILHSVVASDPRLEERIGFWVDFWTSRGSNHFTVYLERMARWEHYVEAELALRGLPLSLKYLPIVESGYHDVIVSRVGATGMWQLMPPTARELGLTVSAVIDDRRDPLASTRAALDYLETMHGMFGSWFLALAAYNAGPGRIRGIVNRHAPGRDALGDLDYLELRPHLPAETREFVPRFFAAARIARNPEQYGFERPVNVALPEWDEVLVPDATSLDVVAWAAGVEESDVIELNRHYLRGFTPAGETRAVRIPAGTAGRFATNYALVPPEERISFMEHAVARGETLGGIAGRYGVRLADLQAANGRLDPRRLQVGQRLVIPVAGSRGRPPSVVAEAPPPAPTEPQGETEALRAAEDAARSVVAATTRAPVSEPVIDPVAVERSPSDNGDRATDSDTDSDTASPTAADRAEAPARMHRVVSGDNLWALARRYGVSVAELQRWNGLGSSSALRVGQQLAVGAGTRSHLVSRGDTWGALARRYGITTAALAQANGRTTRNVIRVGETLRIPEA